MHMANKLHKLLHQWRGLKIATILLLAAGCTLPLWAMLYTWWPPGAWIIWPVAAGGALWFSYRIFRKDEEAVCSYLNSQYPTLEQSADLLLQEPHQLRSLQQLQQKKVAQVLDGLTVRLPHQIPQAIGVLLMGVALFAIIRSSELSAQSSQITAADLQFAPQQPLADTLTYQPPQLQKVDILVQPPAYTNIEDFQPQTLDIDVPYWSVIDWQLSFTGPVEGMQLVLSDGQKINGIPESDTRWRVRFRPTENTFYQLAFDDKQGGTHQSDYFKLQVLPDIVPTVEVLGLPAYSELVYTPEKVVSLRAILQDDYGIADAWIVATLTKGEGEAVQFKNDTLRFAQSFSQQRKNYEVGHDLQLTKLGMEPGDELYLHIEATDNRQPIPQRGKTSKFIIAFEDTTQFNLDMEGKMAVDRMPEYFRSQRQIIIDTEKLIAKKDALDKEAYWAQSNAIAGDQKLLRLRYGQFLGEEFETVIGPGQAGGHDHDLPEGHEHETPEEHAAHDHEDHDHHDHDHSTELPEGHEHETPEEHAAHAHEHSHGHSHDQPPGWAQKNPVEADIQAALEPYSHIHDISEEVTYFDAATAIKLRAALAHMWDAELHLRMGRPKEALPYEYKALQLIKEVQQASRIYVERVGFEPPVIKEAEKRLSGELDAIQNPTIRQTTAASPVYPAIRAAIPVLEKMKQQPLPAAHRVTLQKAGEELAALVLQQEGLYLVQLRQLRALMDQELEGQDRKDALREVLKCFWQLTPDTTTPQQNAAAGGDLSDFFFESLSKARR
jgi:hypothetical protein